MEINKALTFDDVLLVPKYSEILPSEVNTSINLSSNLKLKIPLISSAMDTVTGAKMAIAMAQNGGLGVIHRNLSVEKQLKQVELVKKKHLKVAAAIGVGISEVERAEGLLEKNIDLIVIDTAHGHTKKVKETLKKITKLRKKTSICVGNVATPEAAKFLIKNGADIIKIGIGPGSICTTRMVAGIGVPQLSAILDIKKKIKTTKISFISDGGIKFSGDLAKAFSAGADAIMIGSLFAGTDQAPGKIIKKNGKSYKKFRGMGSIGAMSQGSADRYNQQNISKKTKFVAEGVEGFIRYKGDVNKIVYQLIGGLKSSMGYLGCSNIKSLRKKPKFITITKAGFYESMVHNIDLVKG